MTQEFKSIELTPEMKLQCFQFKYYNGLEWIPKKGDFYTTTRADLEVYQVVDVDEEFIYTKYTSELSSGEISKWDKDKFLTEGFGDRRMWIPDFLIK